jgi:hypothetical protein
MDMPRILFVPLTPRGHRGAEEENWHLCVGVRSREMVRRACVQVDGRKVDGRDADMVVRLEGRWSKVAEQLQLVMTWGNSLEYAYNVRTGVRFSNVN